MRLDTVTITGADESVDPAALRALSEEFPFVEWGILFGRQEGVPRFPARNWLCELEIVARATMRLSAHLCSHWVRSFVCDSDFSWRREYRMLDGRCARLQLNFHGQYHKASMAFPGLLRDRHREFILQHDGVNDGLICTFSVGGAIRAHPLFDRSGGRGQSPETWPTPFGLRCGYAGGIGPDNVAAEIGRIRAVVDASAYGPDTKVWIDMESRVRSEDGVRLDLGKVRAVLAAAAPHIAKEK